MNIDHDYLNKKNSEQYKVLYEKVRKYLINTIVVSSQSSKSFGNTLFTFIFLGIFILLISIKEFISFPGLIVYIGGYLIIMLIGITYINWNVRYVPNIRLNILDSIYRRTKNTKYTIEDINEILAITKDLSSFIKNKSYLQEDFITFVLFILTDLRSDLSIRLTEQQSTLESAKSEVEQNIKGTTELNQVSELQRARLDRQIEQFEELQRVLIKI